VTYASKYAASTSLYEGVVNLATYLATPLHLNVFFGFWCLAIIGLVFALRNTAIRNQIGFLLLLLFFSFLATATGFYFRRHYFILLLPAFALTVGVGVRLLQERLETGGAGPAARMLPAALLAGALLWNVLSQRDSFFQLPPEEVGRKAYIDEHFAECIPAARYIREHSSPNDTIAVVGSEPEIYFYARRHSATGYIYTYALMETQPFAGFMQREMEGEIEAAQPEFLVDVGYDNSWVVRSGSDLGIFQWFKSYAANFYERVGIIDTRSTGETHYLWGDDAKNYHGAVAQYLAIYRRKGAPRPPAGQDQKHAHKASALLGAAPNHYR
jgi:hypothetical protein